MGGQIDAQPSKVVRGAWWTLASCMSTMLVAGTLYGFGAWSPAIKDAYHFNQDVIATMAVASHLGNYIVIDSGMLITRFGTVFGMVLGCTYASVGYLFLWSCIVIWPGQVPTGFIIAACWLFGHGCGTIDNAVMTEALSDFRAFKGYANGCIKAYYGLGTATVAMIYEAVFRPNKASFLLFLGIYAALCAVVFVPVVAKTKGLVDGSARTNAKKFRFLAVGIFVFALYFFMVQLFKNHITQKWWKIILLTVVVGMASLFALPIDFRPNRKRSDSGVIVVKVIVPPPVRDVSGLKMMTYLDFWLFVCVCVVGQGIGLMTISNASQILPACIGRNADHDTTAFVASIAIFNSLARLVFGMSSEKLRGKVPRSVFFVIAIFFLTCGCTLFWLGNGSSTWVAAVLVGFGYGGLWGVQPPMVSELFGMSDFSFKYSMSAMAAAAGSVLFNEFLAVPVFEKAAEGRPEYPKCYDSSCFVPSFRIAALAGIPTLLVACWLVKRTLWLYKEPGLNEDDSSSESSTDDEHSVRDDAEASEDSS